MMAGRSHKDEIEAKLKQEQDFTSVIRGSLQRNDQLTSRLESVLSSCESRLERLENSLIPVHQQTQILHNVKLNVDETLICLDQVIYHYQVIRETDRTIAQGPTGRLGEYLACLDQIRRSEEYFQENNPDGPELKTLRVRFERGKDLLQSEVQALLLRHSRPVPPVDILTLIDTGTLLENRSVDIFPSSVIYDVTSISAWLLENNCHQEGKSEEDLALAGKWSGHLSSSVHQRALSLDREPSRGSLRLLSTAGSLTRVATLPVHNRLKTRSLNVLQEPLPGFGKVRPHIGFNLLSLYSHIRSRQLEHSLKDFRDHLKKCKFSSETLSCLSSQDKHKDSLSRKTKRPGKEDLLNVESGTFYQSVDAFCVLAEMEFTTLSKVFPHVYWEKVYDCLIQEGMKTLIQEGESIFSAVRQAIVRHEFSAVLTILRVIKFLKKNKPALDSALQYTTSNTKRMLPSLVTSMEKVATKGLEMYADHIKQFADKESNLPVDGTVHESTSNVILFLSQLLAQERPKSSTPPEASKNESSNDPLILVTCKALDNLIQAIQNKARTYKDPVLRTVFLLNNYNYMLKSTPVSHMHEEKSATELTDKLRGLIDKQKQIYLQSWVKVAQCLMDNNMSTAQQGNKLKEGEEHEHIKEKFKRFNDGLEGMCRTQKAWAMPDQEQRDVLLHTLKSSICQDYRTFLERYGHVTFTKHPEKYQKYSPEQVEDMIGQLFDLSA